MDCQADLMLHHDSARKHTQKPATAECSALYYHNAGRKLITKSEIIALLSQPAFWCNAALNQC